jgi:hypothetical protein
MTTTLKNFARHGIAWEKGEPVPESQFEPDEFAELESLGLIGKEKNESPHFPVQSSARGHQKKASGNPKK